MNCERCQAELEDFLYGESGAAQMTAIRTHLNECADCRAAQKLLEQESEIFVQYYEQSELDPSPEMWQAIRQEIQAIPVAIQSQPGLIGWLRGFPGILSGQRLPSPALLRQAAFAIALVVFSVAATTFYFTFIRGNNNPAPPETAFVTPSPLPSQPVTGTTPAPPPEKTLPSDIPTGAEPSRERKTPVSQERLVQAAMKKAAEVPFAGDDLIRQQVARAAREYQQAVVLLDRKIAARRDSLDPAMVAQYEKSLELINQSIDESRRALQERPNDPTASQFLLAAYTRKVGLMQEVALQ